MNWLHLKISSCMESFCILNLKSSCMESFCILNLKFVWFTCGNTFDPCLTISMFLLWDGFRLRPLSTRTVMSKDRHIKGWLCQRTVISKGEILRPRPRVVITPLRFCFQCFKPSCLDLLSPKTNFVLI